MVGFLVFASCAYFHGGSSANQNARLDAIFSFVEPGTPYTGTFRIDAFLLPPQRRINTVDWAISGGHYYANKAPGTILIGTAIYGALYYLQRATGTDPDDPFMQQINSYLINLGVSCLFSALAAIAFLRMLRRSVSESTAALLTLGLFLGTAMLPYSTQLWGATTAAAFVVLALYRAQAGSVAGDAWTGFWLAAATVTDYLAALAAVTIGLCVVLQRPRRTLVVAAGALPPTLVMLAYHQYCFGNPFTLASSLSNPVFLDQQRALGLFGAFNFGAWLHITLTPYRGILVQMPILLFGLFGLVAWFRRDRRDPWLWTCGATFVLSTLVVASFNGWYGGATVCARYLLPFLPLGWLAAKEIRWTRLRAAFAFALGLLSVFNMLAIAAVTPLASEPDPNPLYGTIYRTFFAGVMSPRYLPIRLHFFHPQAEDLAAWTAWNWGELFGLKGLWSLLPLLALWLVVGVYLLRKHGQRDAVAASEPPPGVAGEA